MKQKTKKRIKRAILTTLIIIGVPAVAVFIFIQQPSFGSTPSGERLERVKRSPDYRDGKFQNLSYTPQLTGDKGFVGSMIDFLFGKKERVTPIDELPHVDTDLHRLDRSEDLLVWFGHSSYFIQIDGKRVLADPVFSSAASPVPFINKAYKGADTYKSEDIPEVDYLFISHDHWDHLDYNTIMQLKDRIGKVICGLGVGEHFERWGFRKDQIVEMDWNEESALDDGFTAYFLPARHFSGRGLSPNQSLWISLLLQTPTMKIYLGGDSGYDSFFSQIGERFGEIDLAILENGQYDQDWKYIHMMPEETAQAARDLRAKVLLPVHNSKFSLSVHAWDAPIKGLTVAAQKTGQRVLTPMIGEVVHLKDSTQVFKEWWVGVE